MHSCQGTPADASNGSMRKHASTKIGPPQPPDRGHESWCTACRGARDSYIEGEAGGEGGRGAGASPMLVMAYGMKKGVIFL